MNYVAMQARDLWTSIPAAGYIVPLKERKPGAFLYGTERACTLALLEMFGLMTVEREEPAEGQNWRVTKVCHTQFGDELLTLVFGEIRRELFGEERYTSGLGAWQPALQPSHPRWVNNLRFPEPEFRDGVYYFKVSLGKPWRRIAIPATSNLEDLAQSIIGAFNFDGDHLHCFHYVARDGRTIRIDHPYLNDADMHTDEVAIGMLPLSERQSMKFHYDFGAGWRFDVQLEKIEPGNAKVSTPTIVASRGKAPAEYEYE
jgi:hypothetical protein